MYACMHARSNMCQVDIYNNFAVKQTLYDVHSLLCFCCHENSDQPNVTVWQEHKYEHLHVLS